MPVDVARAKMVFLAASDLADAVQRNAYLDRACGQDADLRARVEELLRAERETPSDVTAAIDLPLTAGVFDPNADLATFVHDDALTAESSGRSERAFPTTVIAGRYSLVKVIGEGGMGAVYLAIQTEPVKRQVALKLIKSGMDSRSVLARFDAERQALALMDHPNIARIYDGGVTPTGQPFFVMELVNGVPLTEYCDAHQLSVAARLQLFVAVCQAVQHAHQKGIIHRDLKPGNVLVTEVDGRPTPKVIDFGVAKATEQKLTEMSFSDVGAIVGTPAYMSPEQAAPSSMDIDTRTDVYSLGVMLYELLTGSPPIDSSQFKHGAILEMLRMVREVEPPRPSTKLSNADALPNVAANRSIEPAKLANLMQGELDWVVMKALEKDRDRRYETANGLARDIQRYLEDEVVEARPPSQAYRLKKFVRRNKTQVIAAGLVLFALVVGFAGTTVGLFEAKKQQRLAESAQKAEAKRAEGERVAKLEAEAKRVEAEQQQQRAEAGEKLAGERLVQVEAEKRRAEEEKQIAQAVKDFLQYNLLALADTTAQADALLKEGESSSEATLNPTIRELLDRAAKGLAPDFIEARFPKQPLVQAEILRTVGSTYRAIGEAATGIDFLKRSELLFHQHLGADAPDTLESMNLLAMCYHFAGSIAEALPLYEETLKLYKAKLGPDHPDTLTSMNNLASCYSDAGKLDMAMPLYEETLKLRIAKFGPDHPVTLGSMNGLAEGYRKTGKIEQALPLYEQLFEGRKATLGPDHPSTLTSMNNLATGYKEAGQLDKALPLYEKTLALREAKLGPDDPATLTSMNNLALAYKSTGKLAKALPLYEECFKLRNTKLGHDHPSTLTSMNNLAEAYSAIGKLDKALPLYEESLKLRIAKSGPDHPNTLSNMENLANGYKAIGKLEMAWPLWEEAIKLRKAKLGPDHPKTMNSMGNLAIAYKNAGKLDKALPLYIETLELMKVKYGHDHPDTLTSMNNLAIGYEAARKYAEATSLYEEMWKLCKAKYGPDHPETLTSIKSLASAYEESEQFDKAEVLYRERLALVRQKSGSDSQAYADALAPLAQNLLSQKNWTDAEPLLRECLAILEKTQPDVWSTFNTQSLLGGALLGQKKYDDAEPLLLKGYEGIKARKKSNSRQNSTRLREAVDRLIELYSATQKPDKVTTWQDERAKYRSSKSEPK